MTDGDEEWEGMIGALRIYKKLHDFMAKTIIKDEDKEKHQQEIYQFEKDVIEFYKHGQDSFLKDHHSNLGGGETTYMHTFRFYVPRLAQRAWDELHVGIGIFNTQGVEARNKESKFIWDHGTNCWNKDNHQVRQVMNKLHNISRC